MASFWRGNVLLTNARAKAYQKMRGQEVVRPLEFFPEKFNQTDIQFTP